MLAVGNFISLMITGYAELAATNPDGTKCIPTKEAPCLVDFFGSRVSPSSLSLYMSSIGVVIQAFILITFSALADRIFWRSRFILASTSIGGLSASTFFFFTNPSHYLTLALLTALSNASVGIASAFYYSYLPVLVRNHPDVLHAVEQAAGLTQDEKDKNIAFVRDRVSNHISGISLATGLISGSVVLFIAAFIGSSLSAGPYVQQVGAGMAGTWWLVMGLVGWWILPKIEGPPLPENRNVFTHSACMLWNSFKNVGTSWYIWLGLLSWFFISDGLTTALMVTIFVGRGPAIGVTGTESVYLSAAAPLAEALGIIGLTYMKRSLFPSSSTKGMNIFLTVICAILTMWGILGLHTSVGITSKPEFFVYFTIFVTIYACLQSFHRVLFAELVPRGREAEFFGLYLISSRGTGWIGSTVVGIINDQTKVIRNGYYFVLFLFVGGIIAILPLNMTRGHRNASKLASSV